MREIMEQVATHPLVVHFEEEHSGERQEILMRVLVTPNTALERQIWESVMIDKQDTKPDSYLNLKSEW